MTFIDEVRLNEEPTQLLGDRLRMRVSAKAWIDGRREGGLMGLQVSNMREQRVGTDVGDQRMISFVEDMLLLSDGFDPEGSAPEMAEGMARAYQVPCTHMSRPPAGGCLLVAQQAAQGREAIPQAVVWLAHPDGTMLKVSFLLSQSAAAEDWGSWLAVVMAMARSIVPGERALQRQARSMKLDWAHKPAVELDLDDNFLVSADRGHDFVVHRIDELAPMGEFGAYMGIYLGGHPAYHHSRMNPRPEVEVVQGELMGQPVQWQRYPVDDVIKMEGIARVEHLRVLMHVFLTGVDEADCQRLLRMLGTLRGVEGAG